MDKKLLMVLGPTEIEEDVLQAGAKAQVYMRTSILKDLRKFLEICNTFFKQKILLYFLLHPEQELWKPQ